MASIGQKWLAIYTAALFISTPFLGLVSADGAVLMNSQEMFTLTEDSQYAIINYVGGVQKMTISVQFDWENTERATWIFPVPARAEDVKADVAYGLPTFHGIDVLDQAEDTYEQATSDFVTSYALSFAAPWPLWALYGSVVSLSIPGEGISPTTVHEHLEKYGLIVEVVSSTDGKGLYNYLDGSGLDVQRGLIPQLDDYVDKNYSFVVTWINDTDDPVEAVGVVVEFPTAEAYYPMILTSVYEDMIVPTTVLVNGHVTPRIYKSIEQYSNVSYWSNAYYYSREMSPELEDFMSEMNTKELTTIEIHAPSYALEEDLWISSEVPEDVQRVKAALEPFQGLSMLVTGIIMPFVISIFLCLAIGLVIFGRNKHSVELMVISIFATYTGIMALYFTWMFFRGDWRLNRDSVAAHLALCGITFPVSVVVYFWTIHFLSMTL